MVSSPFFAEIIYLIKEKPQGGSKEFVEGLRCREFDGKYDVFPISVLEFDIGALEVICCCDEIKEQLTVEKIMRTPKAMWRNDP